MGKFKNINGKIEYSRFNRFMFKLVCGLNKLIIGFSILGILVKLFWEKRKKK